MNTTPLNDAANSTGGESSQPVTPAAAEPAAAAVAPDSKPTEALPATVANPDGEAGHAVDTTGDAEKPVVNEKPPGAPEGKYELKLAEGVKLAPEVQEKFETIARDLNLPQEAAQKMIDLAPELSKMYASQLIETAKESSTKWAGETRMDKEIGGNGDKATLDANLAMVAKARNAFASPELVALLEDFDPKKNPNGTGLGNHPEVVRHFLRIGKSISEDSKLVTGVTTPSVEEKTQAQRLYSNNSKK